MFKMCVTVAKHQHFKSFINQITSIRLEDASSNVEKSFASNFKIDNHFFKLGYDAFSFAMAFGSSASQHSIV